MLREGRLEGQRLAIAVVVGSISRLAGGFYTSVRRSAQRLVEAGHDVTVLAFRDHRTAEDLPAWAPLRPLVFTGPGGASVSPGTALGRSLRNGGFDIVHQHGIWQPFSRQVVRWRGSARPVMISPRGMLDGWALGNAGWKKRIAAALYENANLHGARCLHALTMAEADAFRAYGLKNPVAVIPNGIDLPADRPEPPPPWWPTRHRVLLFIGRIHRKKGLLALVEALARLSRDAPEVARQWRTVIAGWDDGGHAGELAAAIARHGLREEILLPGALFGAEKAAALRHAEAFVLPSRSEGLPMSVLEAWSHRLPVFMTAACHLPEGVTHGAAMTIDPAPEAMAHAFAAKLAGDRASLSAIGARGRALVERRFAWPEIAARHGEVYRWIAGGSRHDARPDCVLLTKHDGG